MNAAKTFPGFFYWIRLPGFVTFCGVSAGICAAKIALAQWPDIAPKTILYHKILFFAMIILFFTGILQKKPFLRVIFFTISGMALFAGAELGLRGFYAGMEAVGENRQIMTLTVRITSPVAAGQQGVSKFRARVAGADEEEVARALMGKTLQITTRGSVPPYGMITIQGKYAAPRPAAGPLGFDQREHFAVNNIHGSFSVSRILSDKVELSTDKQTSTDGQSSPARQSSPPKGSFTDKLSYNLRIQVYKIINKSSDLNARAIFHAAFLGEKEHLTQSLNDTFRKAGIIHLLAISGFHAALLYSAVFAVLGLLGIPARQRTLISLAFLWCYLFFIGIIPSLFRATVMVTFFCLSMMFQRKNHVVHSLGMAGVLWLLISPHSLFAPGFQLSFAATAGIVMLQPVLTMLTRAVKSKMRSKPAEFLVEKTLSPLWVSLAGFAATAPPLLYHFGTLSLYGIFFNLIAIPLMSAAMWLFFIAAVLSPIDIAATILVWGAQKALEVIVYLSEFSNNISLSEIVIPSVTAVQLFVMVIFMTGLCAIRKNMRGQYALKVGAAAMLIMAVTTLYSSTQAQTENLEFTRNKSTVNVVIHKDNNAWIIAQGRKSDIRLLRTREIESLLYRKKIRNVPLFVVNEDAEDEAHEFTFTTNFNPRIVVLQKEYASTDKKRKDDITDSYTALSYSTIISNDGGCSLRVDGAGRVEIAVRRR